MPFGDTREQLACKVGRRKPLTARGVGQPRDPLVGRALGAYVLAMRVVAQPIKEKSMREAKFSIGQVVRHKIYPFRGVIFDVDPEFLNSEEWLAAIPEPLRPRRDQPFYHLFAENAEGHYTAYVSEQNLAPDESGEPVDHPEIPEVLDALESGAYRLREEYVN